MKRSKAEQSEAIRQVMQLQASGLNPADLRAVVIDRLQVSDRHARRYERAAEKAWAIMAKEDPEALRVSGVVQAVRIREAALAAGDYQRALEAEATRLTLCGRPPPRQQLQRFAARIDADGATTVAGEFGSGMDRPVFVVLDPERRAANEAGPGTTIEADGTAADDRR